MNIDLRTFLWLHDTKISDDVNLYEQSIYSGGDDGKNSLLECFSVSKNTQ